MQLHDYEDAAGRRRAGRVPRRRTRTWPRRCATRAAPPATPRASSTATAPRCCTPWRLMFADGFGARESDRILPVVPMFHANAWGLAHAAVACGADLIMPGPDLSADAARRRSSRSEQVTVAAGVPTIWMGVLPALEGPRHLGAAGHPVRRLGRAQGAVRGVPRAARPADLPGVGHDRDQPGGHRRRPSSPRFAAPARGRAGRPPRHAGPAAARRRAARAVARRTATSVPWDGESRGELQAAGPWIAGSTTTTTARRSRSPTTAGCAPATSPPSTAEGYIQLVDRTKDVVKCGGEWISSVELENEIMAHPKVAEAAVIGVPHPKWQERPLACVVLKEGEELTKDEVLEFLDGRSPSGGCPTTSSSSTRSPRPASASSPRRTCATSSRTTCSPPPDRPTIGSRPGTIREPIGSRDGSGPFVVEGSTGSWCAEVFGTRPSLDRHLAGRCDGVRPDQSRWQIGRQRLALEHRAAPRAAELSRHGGGPAEPRSSDCWCESDRDKPLDTLTRARSCGSASLTEAAIGRATTSKPRWRSAPASRVTSPLPLVLPATWTSSLRHAVIVRSAAGGERRRGSRHGSNGRRLPGDAERVGPLAR